jgi:hypothetical protein
MQQWEYHAVTVDLDWNAFDANAEYNITQSELTRLGNKGWELVGVVPLPRSQGYNSPQTVGIEYTFKRPKPLEERKPAAEMTPESASRIQGVGDSNPASKTAKSGFAQRAQSAAAKKPSSNGKR